MRSALHERLADKLASLPQGPGVYLFKDRSGEVFYVGKAKNLRDRVRAYILGTDTRAFVALLEHCLDDIDVVLTHSEKEALLLENELIKAHRPRFNVKLTDDKRFLCLRLDVRKPYPRLQVVRRFAKDGARYFGPYHSASSIREALRMINRHFQLRTCTDQMMRNRSRPCLQYQIKRCPAPCVFDLTDGTYQRNVADVESFLDGRKSELVDNLKGRMQAHAQGLEFEAAGALRDQVKAIEKSLERQRMVTTDLIDRDVIGLYREGPAIEIHVMRTRKGRLIDARRFALADTELATSDVLADFAGRYYVEAEDLPDEILFPKDMEWSEALALLLAERAGHAVRGLVPVRGDKRRLVELSDRNAHQAFVDKQRERGAAKSALERLQRALKLKRLPSTLECMDISHLQGQQIVASVVHFADGAPRKDRYRHYKIRTTDGQDDFKSMYELVSRRAKRGIEHADLPDLMVIDGGKGQLAAAHAALRDHRVDTVDLISLAKSRATGADNDDAVVPFLDVVAPPEQAADEQPKGATLGPSAASPEDLTQEVVPDNWMNARGDLSSRSAERVFVLGHKNPIVLRQNSAELFLLVRARDEAHRFAITYHRKLRSKAATRSWLDGVAGIGPKRRRDLLRAFGSAAGVKAAEPAAVREVVGDKVALAIEAALAQTGHAKP